MPRTAPDGRLRAGLTICLTRYPEHDGGGAVHLVVRTPPTWADAGQRISLALWDERRPAEGAGLHPHPRPDRRFRLDLHRHLWDAAKADELGERSGAARWPVGRSPTADPAELNPAGLVPPDSGCATDRWAADAALLLHAEQRVGGPVTVRLSARRRLVLELSVSGSPRLVAAPTEGRDPAWPVLPDAATWVPPDLRLLRAGLIVASAGGRTRPRHATSTC